jgi:osmotically-inducible protein OsmY
MTPIISRAMRYAFVAALAAAGMYWFDPVQGRRRRALVRDKLVSGFTAMRHATGVVGRGGVSRTRSLIRSNDVSDEILVERVRAAVGRATSHASAIKVSCSEGVLTLQGAVLKHEHPRVMRAARSAAGVSEVHDELAAYKQPDGVDARLSPGA